MILTEALFEIARAGAGWVLALILAISFFSVAMALERGWFFWKRRIDGLALTRQIFQLLRKGDLKSARALVQRREASECVMLSAGLSELAFGGDAAEAMLSARAAERIQIEANLELLSTLGKSAALLGLFGGALGIIGALCPAGNAGADIAISESLVAAATSRQILESVATAAVGLFVAIGPCAAASIYKQRANTIVNRMDCLAHLVLSQAAALKPVEAEVKPAPAKAA